MNTATAADLLAANLMTPTRAVMLAHGLTLTIAADGSVNFSGDDTEAMWAEAEAAEATARAAAPVKPSAAAGLSILPTHDYTGKDLRVAARRGR